MSRSTARGLLVKFALSALAFLLLGLAIRSNQSQIRDVFRRDVDETRFVVGFVIYMAAILLTFARWFVLLRALDVPLSLAETMRLGFIGNVFNLVIPGAVGGDVIKAGFLYRLVPGKRTQAVASMVIDRVLGLLGLFLLAGLLGLTVWGSAGPQVRRLVLIAWGAVGGGVLGLAVLFSPTLERPLRRLVAGRKRIEAVVADLLAMASVYRERLGVVGVVTVMSVVGHALFVFAFYQVSRALFPVGPSLGQHYVIVPLVLFSTAVPLPFGALGLTEHVSGQLFELVKHPGGAVAMMGYRVLMYAGALVSVVVYLANIRQVREVQAASDADEDALAVQHEAD